MRLPIDTREAILVPQEAVTHPFGLDYVSVGAAEPRDVLVQLGDRHEVDGATMVEVLAGLAEGDVLVLP